MISPITFQGTRPHGLWIREFPLDRYEPSVFLFRSGSIREHVMHIHGITIGYPMPVPLLVTPVRAGFPGPADDFVEEEIDLQRLLIVNRPATRFRRDDGADSDVHLQEVIESDPASGR